jgi:hypothetical protein
MTNPNEIKVKEILFPSWELSLLFGTLGRMSEDGINTDAVYAKIKETGIVDMRVIINGVEFPATAFIELWRKEFDYQVAKEARELAAKHDIFEELNKTVGAVERLLREAAVKAFPHANLDDECY